MNNCSRYDKELEYLNGNVENLTELEQIQLLLDWKDDEDKK
jgi:hypothetical protein